METMVQNRSDLLREISDVLASRREMYLTFASLYFTEVTDADLESMEVSYSEGETEEDLVSEGYQDIARYLKRRHSGTREELAKDFARAILGAGAYEERRATPYESVFTSKDGLLMQDARDGVYAVFCEQKIGVDPELKTPEDHLSFEFEFMAHLSEEAQSKLQEHDLVEAEMLLLSQQTFHTEHLCNWIEAYCDCLQRVAHTSFYQGIAKVTKGSVIMDGEVLEDLVSAVRELQ